MFVLEDTVAAVVNEGYKDYWASIPENPYTKGSFEYGLWEQGFYQAMEDDHADYDAMVSAAKVLQD